MKFRAILLASAALVASSGAFAADVGRFAPAPVVAAPVPTFGLILEGWAGGAFVGFSSGNSDDTDHTSIFDAAGSARVGIPVGSMGLQLDLNGEWTSNNGGEDNFDKSLVGGAHLIFMRDSGGLFGAFGGYGMGTAAGTQANAWFAGLEAQVYFTNWTLYGQAGYFDTTNDEESAIRQAGFARVVGRRFFGNNAMLTLEASLLGGLQDDVEATVQNGYAAGWGVRYDQQFAFVPGASTTLFAGYRGGWFQSSGDGFTVSQPFTDNGTFVDHTIYAGLKLGFGSAGLDLKTNDRIGVSLDLPDIGRWAGAGEIID